MHRYILREKIFSIGDDFTIRNERGDDVFFVDGKVFTIRDTLLFQDMQRNTLATIRRKLLSFGPTYIIERGGRETTVHKHLFTLFRCKFTVDVPGPNDLEAAGSFLDHDYTLTAADGTVAARVHKNWVAMSDSYGIDIADGQDDALILCTAIVIDRCCHEDKGD